MAVAPPFPIPLAGCKGFRCHEPRWSLASCSQGKSYHAQIGYMIGCWWDTTSDMITWRKIRTASKLICHLPFGIAIIPAKVDNSELGWEKTSKCKSIVPTWPIFWAWQERASSNLFSSLPSGLPLTLYLRYSCRAKSEIPIWGNAKCSMMATSSVLQSTMFTCLAKLMHRPSDFVTIKARETLGSTYHLRSQKNLTFKIDS